MPRRTSSFASLLEQRRMSGSRLRMGTLDSGIVEYLNRRINGYYLHEMRFVQMPASCGHNIVVGRDIRLGSFTRSRPTALVRSLAFSELLMSDTHHFCHAWALASLVASTY